MRFNKIIRELNDYINKPDIDLKTLKEVVSIFFNALSKQEQEVFLKRCSNFSFSLYDLLELKVRQVSLLKWFVLNKKLKGINND